MFQFIRRLTGRLVPRKKAASSAVRLIADEVIVSESGREVAHFRWDEVVEVATFKRDFLTWDDIRLAFQVLNQTIEISEDCDGWSELCETMAARLPGILERWYFDVMLPAFETNFRVLYRQTNGTPGTS